MEPPDALQLDDLPFLRRLDWPAARRILLQGQMGPRVVIVLGIDGNNTLQMNLRQDNYVVQAFSAYRADDALSIGIGQGDFGAVMIS